MRVPRWLYGLLLIFISLGLGGLVASCQPTVETELTYEAQPMCNLPIPIVENETIIMHKHDIPTIDAAVPEPTETATFSLG